MEEIITGNKHIYTCRMCGKDSEDFAYFLGRILCQECQDTIVEKVQKYIDREALKRRKRKSRRTPQQHERANKMMYMRNVELKTTREIADEFGISRERVRQIVGNDPTIRAKRNEKFSRYIQESTDKTNEELAKELGRAEGYVSNRRNGTRHKINGDANSPFAVGAKWEEWVAERLNERGFSAKLMPPKNPYYDILVNDIVKINVKASTLYVTAKSIALRSKTKLRKFGLHNFHFEKDICDFYACVVVDESGNTLFIIPTKDIPSYSRNGKYGYCFGFPYPPIYKKSKYIKYLDNYDLIKEALNKSTG